MHYHMKRLTLKNHKVVVLIVKDSLVEGSLLLSLLEKSSKFGMAEVTVTLLQHI